MNAREAQQLYEYAESIKRAIAKDVNGFGIGYTRDASVGLSLEACYEVAETLLSLLPAVEAKQ